jgi:hypothetical protein
VSAAKELNGNLIHPRSENQKTQYQHPVAPIVGEFEEQDEPDNESY